MAISESDSAWWPLQATPAAPARAPRARARCMGAQDRAAQEHLEARASVRPASATAHTRGGRARVPRASRRLACTIESPGNGARYLETRRAGLQVAVRDATTTTSTAGAVCRTCSIARAAGAAAHNNGTPPSITNSGHHHRDFASGSIDPWRHRDHTCRCWLSQCVGWSAVSSGLELGWLGVQQYPSHSISVMSVLTCCDSL